MVKERFKSVTVTDSLKNEGGGVILAEITTPATVADYSHLYPKADNRMYWVDGDGNENVVAEPDENYGEMYWANNGNATVIETAAVPIMVRQTTTGEVSGWDYDVGSTGSITAYSDGTGKVNVASGTHGLITGDEISIRGTTNYNGVWTITKIDDDNFSIPDTWASDEGASDWDEGSYLQAQGSGAGVYLATYSISVAEGGAGGSIVTSKMYVNSTANAKSIGYKTLQGNDYCDLIGQAIITVASNDRVYLTIESAGTNDLTVKYGNLTLHRL